VECHVVGGGGGVRERGGRENGADRDGATFYRLDSPFTLVEASLLLLFTLYWLRW
jgi:hypothetical protein